jgi:aminodeoxyfutalosine synthase
MLKEIQEKLERKKRLNRSDALRLFKTDDIHALGALASQMAEKHNGNKTYYVRNIHINPTNICVNRCGFCAFSRSRGEDGAYELSIKDIIKNIRKAQPVNEVHIVGGLHPDWPFDYYAEMVAKIRRAFPEIHIKAFTAAEIDYMHRISGLGVDDVLGQLKTAGLNAMPGGGAEIFKKEVRDRLCPEKLSGEQWLEVIEAAHNMGIKTNATMLYGHVESYRDRVDHLMLLRDLQDRTGGFQAFIPLAYHPENTGIGAGSSGLDDLRTIAVSRLVLDNIPHIKSYWVMLGEKVSQLALMFGADDLDGTVIEEKITYAAGGKSRRGITEEELIRLIKMAGKRPIRRDAFYRAVRS